MSSLRSFLFNAMPSSEIYPLSLHDALPISLGSGALRTTWQITLPLALPAILAGFLLSFLEAIELFGPPAFIDRKSTRLNSSHVKSSYAAFCLKKKNQPCSFEHEAELGCLDW